MGMAAARSWTAGEMAAHVARIDADGYTIIPDFLDAADLAEVRRVLGFYLGTHGGRNDFEGFRTERVYTLVARGRVFWRIALDPRVLALCDHYLLPGYLLTASQAIRIEPGETPQPFHTDDSFYTIPRPRPMVSLSTIVAVDGFTAAWIASPGPARRPPAPGSPARRPAAAGPPARRPSAP